MAKTVKYHRLDFSYQEFEGLSKNISFTNIGSYYVYQKIGSGKFGQVYKAINDETKLVVAVKLTDIRLIKLEQSQNLQIKLRLAETQDKMMALCRSDYIVDCYEVYQNEDLKIIVMEYCNGGTLSNYIQNRRKIPEKEAILILKQIISGIAELHSQNIIHRDLKADNILLHNNYFKLADFGLSKELPSEKDLTFTILGTVETMAPEVLLGRKYNMKADIWSIGIIFYKMLFGQSPFRRGLNLSMPLEANTQISQEVNDLLKQILVDDPQKRISWRQLIKHPIFKKTQDNRKIQQALTQNVALPSQELNLSESGTSVYQLQQNGKLKKVQSFKVRQKIKQAKLTPQQQVFQWIYEIHNQCLKTQLIFEEIIEKIEQLNLLNFQKREVIQFMYLISTRSFLDLSPIRNKMTLIRNTITSYHSIYDAVQRLYQRLKKRWEHYLKILTDLQNSLMSRFTDFLQSNSIIEEKNKFMNGIENKDFTKEQQLVFIQKVYISELRDKIQSVAGGSRVRDLLMWYKQINMIKAEVYHLQGFSAYINRLVKH